jgi:hypothetical protein
MFMLPEFKPTLESIPPCPYITPPADRVEHWRQRLPRDGKRLQLDGPVAGTRMRASCARCLLPT